MTLTFDPCKALAKWKHMISNIIQQRIDFYSNNPEHLPRRPVMTANKVKHIIKKFHSQFLLVPADKAANNIMFDENITWKS